jgi:hypothetical protein
MPALIYRLLKLAWRYRRMIALGLTIFVSVWEKNRERLPSALQKYEPPRRFSKKAQAAEQVAFEKEEAAKIKASKK